MALDVTDEIQVRAFREQQIARGRKPADVDAFINQKREEYYSKEAYKTTSDIENVPTELRPKVIYETSQEGFVATPKKDAGTLAYEKGEETKRFYKNQALDLAYKLKNTDTRGVTGFLGAINPAKLLPGTDIQNTLAIKDQLANTLKVVSRSAVVGQGQGSVSDLEQQMLADASSKLEKPLSNEDFQNEIQNIIDILNGKYSDPNFNPETYNKNENTKELTNKPPVLGGLDKNKMVKGISDVLPAVGGIVGGVAGGVVGAPAFGVGAIPASAAGTALGVSAGIGLGESLENIFGVQEETNEEQLKEMVVEPVVAGTLDLATAGLFKLGGKVITTLGSKILNIADDLPLRILRPTKTQQTNFLQRTGMELKDFMIEKGLFKKGVEHVDEIITPLQQSFDDIALKTDLQISRGSVAANFDKMIFDLADEPFDGIPKDIKTLERIIKAIPDESIREQAMKIFKRRNDFVKSKTPLTVKQLTLLRRKLDKLISEKGFGQPDISAGMDKITRDVYQDTIQQATEGITVGGKSLKEMGTELSKLYKFRDIAEVQSRLGTGTLPFGLLKTIGLGSVGGAVGYGSGGNLSSAGKGFLLSIGAPMLLNNPKVIAFLYKNMNKLGMVTQGLPQNVRAKFLTDAFRRMLTNVGAIQIAEFGMEDPFKANKQAVSEYTPKPTQNIQPTQ